MEEAKKRPSFQKWWIIAILVLVVFTVVVCIVLTSSDDSGQDLTRGIRATGEKSKPRSTDLPNPEENIEEPGAKNKPKPSKPKTPKPNSKQAMIEQLTRIEESVDSIAENQAKLTEMVTKLTEDQTTLMESVDMLSSSLDVVHEKLDRLHIVSNDTLYGLYGVSTVLGISNSTPQISSSIPPSAYRKVDCTDTEDSSKDESADTEDSSEDENMSDCICVGEHNCASKYTCNLGTGNNDADQFLYFNEYMEYGSQTKLLVAYDNNAIISLSATYGTDENGIICSIGSGNVRDPANQATILLGSGDNRLLVGVRLHYDTDIRQLTFNVYDSDGDFHEIYGPYGAPSESISDLDTACCCDDKGLSVLGGTANDNVIHSLSFISNV